MRKTLVATTIASVLLLSACSSQQADTQTQVETAAETQTANVENILFQISSTTMITEKKKCSIS